MKEIDNSTLRVLQMLQKQAHKMPLWEAMSHVEKFQEYRNEIDKAQYIIVVMLEDILGFNSNASLQDKEIAERLKNASDEVWAVLDMCTTIHAGYACSPFTPKDWKQQMYNKFAKTKENIAIYKQSQLSIFNE